MLRHAGPLMKFSSALIFVLAIGVGAWAQDVDDVAAVADAAMRGDQARLRELVSGSADVNAPQNDGATALHWAVVRGDLETVELLLASGADPGRANRDGMTPLLLGAINGHARIVEALLDAGADVGGTLPNGETPLMMASRTGEVATIEALLDRGADVGATEDLRGTTALMWAAAEGHVDALRVLIENGADVGARSGTRDPGRGPYLAPTARSRIEGARRGTGQAGADTAREAFGGADAAEGGADPALSDPDAPRTSSGGDTGEDAGLGFGGRNGGEREQTGGLTALIFASRQGHLESVRVLLDAGADVNQTSVDGWSALLVATQNRYYGLATYLLERGADPNIANRGGWTPLYIATDNRNIEGGDYPTRKPDVDHLDYIRTLLDHGADPNLRMASSTETRTIFTHQWLYEDGATPFLRAAQSGDVTLLHLLLDHGADPSIATTNNTTPLMVASGIGWVEGVTYEWSPEETIETVNLLLELGADVNAVDNDGRSALQGAAHKGATRVVEILAEAGADLDHRDYGSRDSINILEGVTWTALDYADGLVRVGVQSSIAHPETAAVLRRLMEEAGLEVPPEGRTLDSICITAVCQ